jgi:hypothetical protein
MWAGDRYAAGRQCGGLATSLNPRCSRTAVRALSATLSSAVVSAKHQADMTKLGVDHDRRHRLP